MVVVALSYSSHVSYFQHWHLRTRLDIACSLLFLSFAKLLNQHFFVLFFQLYVTNKSKTQTRHISTNLEINSSLAAYWVNGKQQKQQYSMLYNGLYFTHKGFL